jgi:ssDNA-binding Zn-finger/Zn-ribbon topoisomerase 1
MIQNTNEYDYRVTEICPNCGTKMKHNSSDWIGFIECEYALTCPNCGIIDYFAYGNWEEDYYKRMNKNDTD